MSFLSPLGQPTQAEYHIPRSFIKPGKNFLVVLEEQDADPKDIEILTVNRDTICSMSSQMHPPHVNAFERKGGKFQIVAGVSAATAQLKCPNYKKIVAVEFASFGTPEGVCGTYAIGSCDAPGTKKIVEEKCLGQTECTVPSDPGLFFKVDPCPTVKIKRLAIQVMCSH